VTPKVPAGLTGYRWMRPTFESLWGVGTYSACVERSAPAKGSDDAMFALWVTARLPRPWSWSARCAINCTR
jgi:hypothetical protein